MSKLITWTNVFKGVHQRTPLSIQKWGFIYSGLPPIHSGNQTDQWGRRCLKTRQWEGRVCATWRGTSASLRRETNSWRRRDWLVRVKWVSRGLGPPGFPFYCKSPTQQQSQSQVMVCVDTIYSIHWRRAWTPTQGEIGNCEHLHDFCYLLRLMLTICFRYTTTKWSPVTCSESEKSSSELSPVVALRQQYTRYRSTLPSSLQSSTVIIQSTTNERRFNSYRKTSLRHQSVFSKFILKSQSARVSTYEFVVN